MEFKIHIFILKYQYIKKFDINVEFKFFFVFYNREVSMQPWDTWRKIIGIITFTTQ